MTALAAISSFVAGAEPPAPARERASVALCDTVGVILAGAVEAAARIVQSVNLEDSTGRCHVLGTALRASAPDAALANAVAAHALDYDDMCFVSMAHPSCALVPAVIAAGELAGASGRTVLEGYVAGFEVECRLGSIMNPRHYHERGWHCTSSIGTVGAAAAACRVLGLSARQSSHALAIAASLAGGLKENIGTMTKPLHTGAAARNGLTAALLAQRGFTASDQAIDGPQGYLAAMDSGGSAADLASAAADLGKRWEILDTGISVKLYPSCAATHPPLDLLLGLVRTHRLSAADIASIAIEVDTMTPRLLIYDRPRTGLEAKFSMPFCAAAAVACGHPGVDAFDEHRLHDARVQDLMPRVTMRGSADLDKGAPLSRARVTVRLHDGRELKDEADGARGYPGRLTDAELETKFLACAQRTVSNAAAHAAFAATRSLDAAPDLSAFLSTTHVR